ncbi:methyltransferase domain-containing protein [Wenzhouxiangella sp. EGI_FJ10409]|uniref:hypothetical protein n=1 Tax=Wenzhouxiangella sp. EGI_FJ10409 TaxID=3243767 RepID=UPI0035D74BC7
MKPIVEAYFRAYPWLARSPIKTGLATGLALGLFRREDFHYLDELNAGRTGKWASESHNLRGLLPWESEALKAHFPSRGRLLITAAGGGREVLALEPLGYELEAFECNPELTAAANRHLEKHRMNSRVQICPRDEAPATTGRFDGVVVGWGSYTLIMNRDKRVEFLSSLAGHLDDGAPLLLSYFALEGEPGPGDRTQRAVASLIRRMRREKPLDDGDVMDWNYRHRFTAEEVRSELADAGYETAHVSEQGYPHAVGIRRVQRDG